MNRKLIAGNWKLNGSLAFNAALVGALRAGLQVSPACSVAVCVPAPYLAQVGGLLSGSAIDLGAQDVSSQAAGAFTGEVSAAMLREFAVRYVIVGHSERRQYHGETDATVADKVRQALACGVTPIVCVGETLAQREAGQTEEVVKRQLAAVIHTNGHCISEIVWPTNRSGRSAPDARRHRRRRSRCMACCVPSSKRPPSARLAWPSCMAAA
jgi:triosephosphate isomerase